MFVSSRSMAGLTVFDGCTAGTGEPLTSFKQGKAIDADVPRVSRQTVQPNQSKDADPLSGILSVLNELMKTLKQMLGEDSKPIAVVPDTTEPVADLVPRSDRKPGNIWSGLYEAKPVFAQEYNVSTHVATIKAAMMRFGQSPADVFKAVGPNGDGYDVTMRDGFKLHLTRDELRAATDASNFSGGDQEMLKDANFIFAAFVKRKQSGNVGNPPYEHFSAALKASVKGEFEKRMLEGLGLVGHMRQALPRHMLEKGAIGIISTGHQRSALVIDGAMDRQGSKGDAPSRSHGYVLV